MRHFFRRVQISGLTGVMVAEGKAVNRPGLASAPGAVFTVALASGRFQEFSCQRIKDADVIAQAFKEFVKVNEKKQQRPSLRQKLKGLQKIVAQNKNKERSRREK